MARKTKEEKTRNMWIVTGCVIALLIVFFGLGYASGKTNATIDSIKNVSNIIDNG